MLRASPIVAVVSLTCLLRAPLPACADGGEVRCSEIIGNDRISVFTSPVPFRAGPVDVSVLVQDARTGELRTEADVSIRLTAADSPTGVLQCRATREAATNKLLRSANFELPSAGRWGVNVVVQDECGSAQTNFEVVAGEPLPAWDAIWLWIGYPALPIVLYTFHEIRRHRRGSL